MEEMKDNQQAQMLNNKCSKLMNSRRLDDSFPEAQGTTWIEQAQLQS